MVWPLAIVPEQPVDELLITCSRIVAEKVAIVPQEVFIKRPIEPLHVGIHLWRAWIGMVMSKTEFQSCIIEVEREFGTIVGLYRRRTIGNNHTGFLQEVGCAC